MLRQGWQTSLIHCLEFLLLGSELAPLNMTSDGSTTFSKTKEKKWVSSSTQVPCLLKTAAQLYLYLCIINKFHKYIPHRHINVVIGKLIYYIMYKIDLIIATTITLNTDANTSTFKTSWVLLVDYRQLQIKPSSHPAFSLYIGLEQMLNARGTRPLHVIPTQQRLTKGMLVE